MDRLNLILMGKTGTGKSTLVNAVMGEDVAPVKSVTRESKVYSKEMMIPMLRDSGDGRFSMVSKSVFLHDTVGLEIDKAVTEKTLEDIKKLILNAQKSEKERDITLVWFCVNYIGDRFEPFEVELIRKLSIEYEIPFVMVITQCLTEEKGELEKQIETDFPELPRIRILARERKTRSGTIPAFGVRELLSKSVLDYDRCKVNILEAKLDKLLDEHRDRLRGMKEAGKACVRRFSERAEKIGYVPILCIPIVHGLCVGMISELNEIVGIDGSKKAAEDIFIGAIAGVIATPLMALPVLSAAVASAYVKAVGKNYLDALLKVVETSSAAELGNSALTIRRIQKELKKRGGGRQDGGIHKRGKTEAG